MRKKKKNQRVSISSPTGIAVVGVSVEVVAAMMAKKKKALVKPSKTPSAAGKSSKPATGALKPAKPKDTSPSTSDIEMAVPSVNARAASPSSDNSDQKRSKVISLHD